LATDHYVELCCELGSCEMARLSLVTSVERQTDRQTDRQTRRDGQAELTVHQ